MKLSQFKNVSVNKTLRYKNGEASVIMANTDFFGEVHFYEINRKLLVDMYDNIFDKMNDISDEEMIFLVIPYICDIEVDIIYEEFASMLENPSVQFTAFTNLAMDSLKEILNMVSNMADMTEKANSMDISVDIKATKQSELDDLYDKLPLTKDRREKSILLNDISRLENELAELE